MVGFYEHLHLRRGHHEVDRRGNVFVELLRERDIIEKVDNTDPGVPSCSPPRARAAGVGRKSHRRRRSRKGHL